MPQRTNSRRSRRDEDEYDDEPRRRPSRTPEGQDDGYDDDEYEEPRSARRGRSRRDQDDEDDAPRSRRAGRSRRDEEDDEEEAPRSRRRSRDEDEEDEAPRRRGTFRGKRDDDEDDEPRSRRASAPKSTVGRGWGGYDEVKNVGSDFVKSWKLPTSRTLIKFLDSEPFATFAEHWLERKGKKSFVCLGQDCPLCDTLGDRPTGYAVFNILDLSDPDNPKVEVWKCGKRVAGILQEFAKDRKTGPLDREDVYFSVFKSGEKGGNVQTNINPVKARDLEEDWDCPPFEADELAEFKRYEEQDFVTVSSRKELKVIASSYDDE